MKQLRYLVMMTLITFSIVACQPEDIEKAEEFFGEIAGDDISQGNDVAPVDEEKFVEQAAPIDVTDAAVQDNVRQSLKTGLIPAIKKMIDHLDSVEGFLDDEGMMGADSEPAMKSQKDAIRSLSKAFAKISPRNMDNTADDTTLDEDLTELADRLFVDMLKFSSKDGNKIIYTVTPAVCEDEYDNTKLDAGCVKLVSKIRVIQKLNSANSGTIALNFEKFRPIAIGYSPDEWFIQTNLAEVKGAVNAITRAARISDDDKLSLPTEFKGVIRITLKNIDANSMSAAIGVLEPIVIKQRNEVGIEVGKGKIIGISVDEAAQTFTAKVSSRAINAMFKETDDYGIEIKMMFAITSITGEMVINGDANTIAINGLVLGDGGFVAKANDKELVRVTASEVNALLILGDELMEANDKISVSTDFDVKLVYNHVPGVNDEEFEMGETSSSFQVVAPALTEVEIMEIDVGTDTAEYHDAWKVLVGGPVSITVTGGVDAGDFDLDLGNCYDMDADNGPEVITCP